MNGRTTGENAKAEHEKSLESVRPQRRYWLAVAGKANCDALASMGYPYYALRTAPKVASGDRCVLYRSGSGGGFIGAFEFIAEGSSVSAKLADARPFTFQLPWKSLATCEGAPVSIVPLIDSLEFIVNKKNYGMALRSTFRPITERDYLMIETLVRKAVSHNRS